MVRRVLRVQLMITLRDSLPRAVRVVAFDSCPHYHLAFSLTLTATPATITATRHRRIHVIARWRHLLLNAAILERS